MCVCVSEDLDLTFVRFTPPVRPLRRQIQRVRSWPGRTLARPRRPAAMGERQGCVPCTVLRPSTAQAANTDGASSAMEQPPDAADSPTPRPRAGPVKDLLVRWHKEVQGTMTCVPRRTAPTRAAQSDAPARKHSRLC